MEDLSSSLLLAAVPSTENFKEAAEASRDDRPALGADGVLELPSREIMDARDVVLLDRSLPRFAIDRDLRLRDVESHLAVKRGLQ